MRLDGYRFAIVMVVVMGVTICVGVTGAALGQTSHPHRTKVAADPGWVEMMTRMEKMNGAMASVEASGDGDLDFVKVMLPHHEAAIEMAKTQLLYGKDPQMRRMAQEIITDQQSEIELMRVWLSKHEAKSPK